MKKKKQQTSKSFNKIPLETLVECIESGAIKEEIPFDALVEHYPTLLDDWYPGFPCKPRKMTEQDPIRCQGRVSKQLVTLELEEEVSIEINENWPEGRHNFFLKKDDLGDWSIIFSSTLENAS